MSATEAASCIRDGLLAGNPNLEVTICPVTDGGEGTLECLAGRPGARWIELPTVDAFQDPISARILDLGDGTFAIESAMSVGLPIQPRLDPLAANTRGVGLMIAHALDLGARRILLALGGSATSDGGTGMAQALGIRFLDERGEVITPGGAALERVAQIDTSKRDPRLRRVMVIGLTDVRAPFLGSGGSALFYAAQKGATLDGQKRLEAGGKNYLDVLIKSGFIAGEKPGDGAAGGMGLAVRALLGGRLESGAEMVLAACDFDHLLEEADLVITGEGCLDNQTAQGKAPMAVLQAARRRGIPCIAIAGKLGADIRELMSQGYARILTTAPAPSQVAPTPEQARLELMETARRLAALID